jgi:hypothetical protein
MILFVIGRNPTKTTPKRCPKQNYSKLADRNLHNNMKILESHFLVDIS